MEEPRRCRGIDFPSGVISLNLGVIRLSTPASDESISNRITQIIKSVLCALKQRSHHVIWQIVTPKCKGTFSVLLFSYTSVCPVGSVGRDQ